ncbi:Subtilisin protease SBT1.6 [Spatholobus suberectus]|nr:Subtilisin protease SBT1.6 [Spatholobus suberectus]
MGSEGEMGIPWNMVPSSQVILRRAIGCADREWNDVNPVGDSLVHAATGFSDCLTIVQSSHLCRQPRVLCIKANQICHPRFLDSFGLWPNTDYADDIIVAVLDTEIWSELQNFSDHNLSLSFPHGKAPANPHTTSPPPSATKKTSMPKPSTKATSPTSNDQSTSLSNQCLTKTLKATEHATSTIIGGGVSNAILFH